MKNDQVYLEHILEAIRRIEEHAVQGRESFFSSHTLQDATLRNLQTLAEATQRVSSERKAAHPEISWTGIAGFRNILVHNYLAIDLAQVWTIIERDVRPLKQAAMKMLQSIRPGE
jgi:uncharacterized protein with HEPN domain